MRTAAIGPFHGMSERTSAVEAPSSESMSGSFSRSGEDGRDDPGFAVEALGKERTERAVDQAGGQDLLLRGPALALEEAARDLARGERLLLVVTGEREEIDAFARARLRGRGHEHDGLAERHERSPPRLLRHPAGLDRQRTSVEIDLDLLEPRLRHSFTPLRHHAACSRNSRGEKEGEKRTGGLLPDAQPLNHALVTLEVASFEVVEQPAALAHELQQPTTGMVVLPVQLEGPVRYPMRFVRSAICTSGAVSVARCRYDCTTSRVRSCATAIPSSSSLVRLSL
jgi:hypothetical protein